MSFVAKVLSLGNRRKSKEAEVTKAPSYSHDTANKESPKFGKALKEDFPFKKGYVNLNHGSFGAYPRQVRDALRYYQDQTDGSPDHFIRYELPKLIDRSRVAMAELLHAPPDTIVMVPNATTAINTVLRNLVYTEGDIIVYFDTIYGACEKIVAYMSETTPAESVKVSVKYPISDADLVAEFRHVVEEQQHQGKNVKVAIYDTISSMPGLRVPFESLTEVCKELGVLSLIDGAHGAGHLDLDLEKLDCDFFVSNLHKWLFTPRASGVFYVPERNQHLLRSTLPTSHGFVPKLKPGQHILNPFEASGKSPFVSNFEYVGTIDCSPYLCVVDALKYRESLGGEAAIRDYCLDLNRKASSRAAEILGTEVLDNAERSLTKCGMSMVRLPIAVGDVRAVTAKAGREFSDYELGVKVRDFLTTVLVRQHNTFIAVTVLYNDAWWVRLSATVYLDMDDFEWGARVLNESCEKVKDGGFVSWLDEKDKKHIAAE